MSLYYIYDWKCSYKQYAGYVCMRRGAAPSYFIHAGLVFTQVTVPYLRSEYGKDFEFDAPVKILDRLLHGM